MAVGSETSAAEVEAAPALVEAPARETPAGRARRRPRWRRAALARARSVGWVRRVPPALEWQDVSLPIMGRVRAALWLPTILLAACAVALVYLAETSGIATTGYDIQRLQAERSEWQLRNEQLALELDKLHSLAWVEAQATTRLGMQRPAKVRHVQPDT
jgi:cell division protein FtsL